MKSTKKEEIIKMLDAFMENSFLIPPTFTEFQGFTDMDGEYKTYSNAERTYFTLEIKQDRKIIHTCTAMKHGTTWRIQGANLLEAKTVKVQLDIHYKYIKAIYNEVHCLNLDRSRLKEIRKKINKKKDEIEDILIEIEILKKQINDSKKSNPCLK